MRIVEADLDSLAARMPSGWAAVKEPEEFWGDLSTHGRLLLKELLAMFHVPEAHRRTVRTTNPIERSFREVRRRTRSIGTFVNDASIERILYGLTAYFNRKFATRVSRGFKKLRVVA